MSNFDFEKTLLNGNKKYIDERINSISTVTSWNDLTDKPFEEKTTMSDTLTWDGKHDGSYDIFIPYMEYFLVSDISISEEELFAGEFKSVWTTGDVFEYEYSQENLYTNDLTYDHLYSNSGVAIVTSESTTHTPGIYLYYFINRDTMSGEEYVKSFTYKGHNVFPTTEVTPIDSKYLYDAILDFGDQETSIENKYFDDSKFKLKGLTYDELITKLRNNEYPKVLLCYKYVYGDYVYDMYSEVNSVNNYNDGIYMTAITRGYTTTNIIELQLRSDNTCVTVTYSLERESY